MEADMATRTAFTATEWQTLQWAVTDTMAYLTLADPGFWDTFKEASAGAKFLAGARTYGQNVLVRELAADIRMDRDRALAGNPADVAGTAAARVREAAQIVAGKAPEDLDAFKAFVLNVAKATAQGAKGVAPSEADAIARIEAALG
jgi:hypothetical protein